MQHQITVANVGANTMTSRELLEYVNEARGHYGESAVRHNDFLARCRDELDGEPYETFVEPAKGRSPAFEVIRMTSDQCKLVAMRESKGVRRRVLSRLNELESRVAKPSFQLPTTFAAALRLAAEQAEEIERQQAALALAAPKVEFVDRYVDSTGLKSFRQVAKLLQANEARFRDFLKDRRIMYKLGGEWVAHQQHIDAGRFEVKAGTSEVSGHAFNSCRFTPKGVSWIAGLWAQYQLEVTA